MKEERIHVGDTVDVWFPCSSDVAGISGVVDWIPAEAGDEWVLIESDGSIVYLQMFGGMRVTSRKVNPARPEPGLPGKGEE